MDCWANTLLKGFILMTKTLAEVINKDIEDEKIARIAADERIETLLYRLSGQVDEIHKAIKGDDFRPGIRTELGNINHRLKEIEKKSVTKKDVEEAIKPIVSRVSKNEKYSFAIFSTAVGALITSIFNK